ncbi:hypothetical protein [Terrabacter sp. C0L_2]|uniref:hypothetical protein n=1 Tax=Terrabacter sp. C0L_2 TaxID=3108389 RepID=UPI002ED3882E|nr:hypothetical protein U5C87_03120 [Terrabacter sp. C0L_2]
MPTSAPSSRTVQLGVAAVVLAGTVAVGLGAYVVASGPDAAEPVHVAAPAVAPAPSAATSPTAPASPSGVLVGDTVSTGLRPLTRELAGVVAGRQTWVRIPWTTDAPVCSVAVTVSSAGAAVGYPNMGGFSSFYRQDRLAASSRDYTAVRLHVPAWSSASSVTADVTASYVSAAKGSGAALPKACTGTPVTRTYRVTLPVGSAATVASPAPGSTGAAETLAARGDVDARSAGSL